MFIHINNTIKNTVDNASIGIDDNIAKKHSTKNPTENKLFLSKKYKKNLFKNDLNYNLNSNMIELPNFIIDTSVNTEIMTAFSENLDSDIYSEKYKYVMFNEYIITYNLIKNIFDNIKK
jgi:hypothetical protein